MKFTRFSLIVSFLLQVSDKIIKVASTFSNLDKALLEEIFPPTSQRCAEQLAASNSKFEFEFDFTSTNERSNWDQNNAQYEKDVYHATIRHIDEDKDRSWEMKIGKGANIYSIIGPYGEAVAPQKHEGGPWIDEVWQSVSVDRNKNKKAGFFIHQAGAYMKDEEYLTEKPFYSPNIASYCEAKRRQCSFASWGQQAHVKTGFKSEVIYFNRYKDCGNGVMEFTSVVHHHAMVPDLEQCKEGDETGELPSPTLIDHLNVPWGGVRASTFPYILLSQPNNQPLKLILPLENFGSRKNIAFVKELGGYILFAQKAPEEIAAPSFKLPNTTQQFLVVDGNKTHESPLHTTRCSKPCLCLFIKHPNEIKSGIRDTNLLFTNPRTNRHITVTRVEHWAWKSTKLFFCPQVDSNTTATASGISSAAALEKLVNDIFQKGDKILIDYDSATSTKSNNKKKIYYGLALVFGKDDTKHFDGQTRWKYRPARIRYGATNRDYNVLSLIIDGQLHSGDTYVSRQYMISDSLKMIQKQSSMWIKETYQNFFTNKQNSKSSIIYLVSSSETTYFGYTIDMHPRETCPSNSKTSRQLVCKGLSIPRQEGSTLYPLFYILCGTKTYIGFDKYFFSPAGKVIRSYVCHGMNKHTRPIWKLLGYFEHNACDEILLEKSKILTFDPDFCTKTNDEDVINDTITTTVTDEL